MRKRGWIIAFIVGIIAIGARPLLVHAGFRYRQARCRELLKLIGNAIQTYEADKQGQLPRRLDVLSNELSNTAFLICPGTGHTPGSFSNAHSWADYVLIDWAAMLGTNSVPNTYPMAYDRSMHNHAGRGVNVLTVDGFVRWDPSARSLNKFMQDHPNLSLPIPE
jgi:hypothetical protein